jgi:hypothetical protein
VPLSRPRLAFVLVAVAAAALLPGPAAADAPTKQECVAANESAQDLQRSGRLLQARLQLLTCAASACPGAVRQDCADRLQAVGQALPTVVLIPKDAGGAVASTAALAVDGVAQSVPLDGTAIAVDPGPHTFTVALAGRPTVSLRLSLKEGDRVRREVVFKAALVPSAPGEAPGESQPDVRTVSATATAEGNVRSMHRIAWSAIGAGAAGMVLGTAFGFLALAKKASLDRECEGTVCPPASLGDIEAMHVNAVAANISFALGLLGLGGGGTILYLYPEGPTKGASPGGADAVVLRPWVGLGDLGMQGRFQ